MTAALLAVVASLCYGVGDFSGGMASRHAPVLRVLLLAAPLGTALLVPLALLVDGTALGGSLVWGAAAGVAGAVGLVVFYAALAAGTMSVVAPLAAVASAAVPVTVGLALGERPGTLGAVGIGLALLAVVLVAAEPAGSVAEPAAAGPGAPAAAGPGASAAAGPGAPARSTALRSAGLALVAGAGFGLFFALLDAAPDGAGLWPVLWGRVATVGVVLVAALATRQVGLPRGRAASWAAASGVLDVGSNVALLLALQSGELVVVSVIASLYPAGTVVLARLVLGERLSRLQQAGLGLAGISVAMLAV